ncbi:hypothetical protein [Parachlamydia acanthamoebae]|uniref:hypothetical protein n=1 Tax=Parachlamydia acanthamoebae TaxID=83552 RepID=UPI0024E1C5A2|nr:hypothetical protein [Parachlamydia acanthamoebae]
MRAILGLILLTFFHSPLPAFFEGKGTSYFIEDVQVSLNDEQHHHLTWHPFENATYFIFGGNTPDFFPDFDNQESVFIAETQVPEFLVEYPFPFYKVTAYVDAPLDFEEKFAPRSLSEEDLKSFELPEDHKLRKKLDKIFSKNGVLASNNALKKAGFRRMIKCKAGMVVAKHPKLEGYRIKAYTDSYNGEEWQAFTRRIKGSRLIRKSIDAHQLNHLLNVPKKWLYAVPKEAGSPRKYILIVQDMDTLGWTLNANWFALHMTKAKLKALYTIIKENKLIDSVYPDNIPFSWDKRLNFVDIEHFNSTNHPIQYRKLLPYLSPEMQTYWKSLISQ